MATSQSTPTIIRAASLKLPQGAIVNGNLAEVLPVDLKDPAQIQEFVAHSWYKYPNEAQGLHPFDGVTEPHFELGPNAKGSRTEIVEIDESAKYSWIKAPRWRGHAMEVGPLARFIVGYAQNKPEFKEPTEKLLRDLGVPVSALFSTLGRTAARALECQWAAHQLRYFQDKLIATIKAGDLATANVDKWEPESWPREARGVGFTEAPRGALAPLDQDPGHQDRQLPVRRADHLERLPARPGRQYRRLRGGPAGHPDGRSGAAAGNHPHAALLRPVPRLLHPCHVAGRPGHGDRHRALGERRA